MDVEFDIKIDLLNGVLKWIAGEAKTQHGIVNRAEAEAKSYGIFDCGRFYEDNLQYQKGMLNGMVHVKVGIEKYIKKLKHEHNETN